MRSSDEARSGARLHPDLPALLVLCAMAFAVAFVRPRLAEAFRSTKSTYDVYALPAADQAPLVSLGFRSALADLTFAHVLVSYGVHIQEKRRFEFVGNYLEFVNELDPKFRAPYRYADTLLTLGGVAPKPEDYARARAILERGMKEFPYDAELWTQAGQFFAYLAPTQLESEAEKREWRLEGARRLARACELVSQNEALPYHCITAASLLSKAGEREATIQFLERVLTVVDNDEVRAIAQSYLQQTAGDVERDRVDYRVERFTTVWRHDLSYVSKDALLVAGPPLDALRCAGKGARGGATCAPTWRSWGEASDRR